MKSYKLVTTYPSVPKTIKEGDIVTFNYGMGLYTHDKTLDTFKADEIEGNNFWQPTNVKNYEILETTKVLGGWLNIIKKVRRISDGFIITIGDYVSSPLDEGEFRVEGLEVDEAMSGKLKIKHGYQATCVDLIEESERPFVRSEEGMKIYEGDPYYFIWTKNPAKKQETYKVYEVSAFRGFGIMESKAENSKWFVKKESAEEFISNSSLFKTEQGTPIFEGDTYWCVNTAPHLWSLFEQTAKERTKLNKTVLAFDTEDDAKEFLMMNKPCLSINDIVNNTSFKFQTVINELREKVSEKL